MMRGDSIKWLCILMILNRINSVCGVCELSFMNNDKLYNYNLNAPLDKYPHGVLSEDGFFKVAENQTVLWFQLCDGMVFNHGPPTCVDCLDCGGPSRCGLECSALMENSIGGYPVCTTLGHVSSTNINIMDKHNPQNGVIVKMSRSGPKYNCSLSVSVICDSNGVQGPRSMERLGICDYATVLRHPSGCATIVPVKGGGWGWFGTFITIILCLFGIFLLAGIVYRYFFLGVRGLHNFFASLVRRFRGPSEGHRSTYSRVNF